MVDTKEKPVEKKEEEKPVEKKEEEKPVVKEVVEEVADVPTYPLNCHWTENEWREYCVRVSKWEEGNWDHLVCHEPMTPFVYKLSFKEFMVQLETDRKSMTIEEIYEKYTGEKDLV
tara:strand:- start:375 stop:722 length:348 start_codon:yes stop_codon:yes gene_type:complete